MARFLLDTNICIYIAKRRPPEVMARFERLQAGEAAYRSSPMANCGWERKKAHPGPSRWNGWNA